MSFPSPLFFILFKAHNRVSRNYIRNDNGEIRNDNGEENLKVIKANRKTAIPDRG
jgi:hypothetical protein